MIVLIHRLADTLKEVSQKMVVLQPKKGIVAMEVVLTDAACAVVLMNVCVEIARRVITTKSENVFSLEKKYATAMELLLTHAACAVARMNACVMKKKHVIT